MDKKAYTEKEKLVLVSLVKEYGACIENKKTDGTSIQEKQNAWENIASYYNAQPDINIHRTSKQLKKLWDNLKQRKRKETTHLRHSQLLTRGGPPSEKKDDPVLELVTDIAKYSDVTRDCLWDSTALYEKYSQSSETVMSPALYLKSTPVKRKVEKPYSRTPKYDTEMQDTEIYWRVLKAKRAVEHQEELHRKRMETAQAEAELAQLKLQAYLKSQGDL
ncbi:hypothetical protein NQ314_003181 [Rhamnusium bicolor]|uniref:Regulatory protein zeste n=1 Tax=Rhamnusium bicolor TaxID=1586634 RepID=A0AAV8ZPI7_9CUCU|nr:hypothetical protein NQ314_003181 [Rhamnusium bicolor]